MSTCACQIKGTAFTYFYVWDLDVLCCTAVVHRSPAWHEWCSNVEDREQDIDVPDLPVTVLGHWREAAARRTTGMGRLPCQGVPCLLGEATHSLSRSLFQGPSHIDQQGLRQWVQASVGYSDTMPGSSVPLHTNSRPLLTRGTACLSSIDSPRPWFPQRRVNEPLPCHEALRSSLISFTPLFSFVPFFPSFCLNKSRSTWSQAATQTHTHKGLLAVRLEGSQTVQRLFLSPWTSYSALWQPFKLAHWTGARAVIPEWVFRANVGPVKSRISSFASYNYYQIIHYY